MKSTLKAPGAKRLKLKYEKVLSSFAFNVNLRRCTKGPAADLHVLLIGRGLHSSTSWLNLSR